MSKQIILISVSAAVIIAAAFFIYRDLNSRNEAGKKTGTEAGQPTGSVDVSLPGGVQIQGGTAQNSEVSAPVTMAVPDLTRQVVFTVAFSDSDKAKITARAAELAGILKKNPDSFGDWLDLGALRKTIGDYEGAKEAWEYAGAIRPKNYVSFSNLGDLFHYYLKDYPRAEENILTAIKNEPSNIAAYRALVDLYTQSYKEKIDEVPKIVAQGLKANPDNYDLLIMLASYYKDRGDKTTAITYYEKASAQASKMGLQNMVKAISDEIKNLSQ